MNKTKRTEAEQQKLLAYIRERYVYVPESGMLRHKKHDKPPKPHKKCGKKYVELEIRWNGKLIYISLHRAVWAICKGRWPKKPLDHINGDEKDNRIENLRECSQSENQLNIELPWEPNLKTGMPGVWLVNNRFRTIIRGKRMYFFSPHEAFCIATLCGKRYRKD